MDAEKAFRRDRAIIFLSLVTVTLLAWLYLFTQPSHGIEHQGHGMAHPQPWETGELLVAFVMWSVMMVGMMIPSASPFILTYTVTRQRHHGPSQSVAATGFFVLGYLAVWTAYSALAAATQWSLHAWTLLTPELVAAMPFLAGALLITAGVFQWTSLKHACLSHCRSPLGFITNQWRDGLTGAFTMGVKHGAYCVGCCWALMLLMFVVGVMNLLWMALLAIYLLFEKVAPGGHLIGRYAGGAFALAGLWVIIDATIRVG